MSVTSEDEEGEGESALLSDTQSNESDVSTSDDEGLPPPLFSQHTFAPPFYGRPPTPLPPSPSLTSLLRPSRPTTPDASDDDPEPLPRASPRVPTYEYYGFVLYLFSSLCFLIYLLWSYLPSPFLHALGIYYYPNRWWSLAIPSFIVMTLVYIYVALAAYNIEIMTLPMSSIETIVDDAAMVAVVDSRGRIRDNERRRRERRRAEKEERHARSERDVLLPGGRGLNWKEVWNEGTDAVMDVPLAGVCEVLYGEGRDDDGDNGEDDDVITRL
ncbi:PIG-P-domain-containing protein [Podospora appendiculata]|uniref:PIG-P-domain-containing protein n=1 Tax=Podospora appendiculata TaxID=314037 RepID=A0AAE0XJF7_9PEZI|nr:PIG-P-domain-containing protein [Podospora appendiculata]